MTFRGKPLIPRGLNLGGWLNLEGYMLGLDGTDWQIRAALRRHLGEAAARRFFDTYERVFVEERDIDEIARLGFNTLRLPLNYRRFESDGRPMEWDEAAFEPIDRLLSWCAARGLAVLLDLHAAPGGQNTTPPADNPTGYPRLWSDRHCQDRVVAFWETMATRYRKHPALLGYNLLNEPQVNQHDELEGAEQAASMNTLYARCLTAIRAIDPDGWIVISPPVRTSGGHRTLDASLFEDVRTAFGYHHYPLASYEVSINFEAQREASNEVERWKNFLAEQTKAELEFARAIDRPVILGEFGWPEGADPRQAAAAMEAQLALHRERGWGWLLWCYKDLERLGLYTVKPDQPWAAFTRDPAWRERRRRCQAAFAKMFDETFIRELGKNEQNALIYDAAWGDGQRGLNRILLEHQAEALAKLPPEEVARMPEAFRLENCQLRGYLMDVLRSFLDGPEENRPSG